MILKKLSMASNGSLMVLDKVDFDEFLKTPLLSLFQWKCFIHNQADLYDKKKAVKACQIAQLGT
jgi:hypothetical protein